ncbi:MAG TPA: MlaD family protein [Bacteroidales bacterium]|nr:MlaD family protein [Bacteroidales bacterium]HOK98169.1 MlaD family protein [Bacteroidales bacterium]HPO65252.1 MlaD family protein [Bacteroidales bacterium]
MKKEVKIGLIMIFTLGILIWGVNFLKGRNFFSRTYNYVVIYDDVSGLLESNGVYIKGYKVGNVHSIDFSDSTLTSLRVVLAIDKDVHIPVGTRARIYNLDLIGNKAVELIFSKSKQMHKPYDTIIGEVEITIAKQLEPYKVQAYNLLNSLDSLTHAIMRIFDPATTARIRQTVKNIETLTAGMVDNLDNTSKSIENIRVFTQNLKENNARINATISQLQAFSTGLNQLQLKQTLNQLDTVLAQTQNLLLTMQSGDGTLTKLLYSDSLYQNLQRTILQLDSLLVDIQQQPRRYLHFSVFGRKQ